MTDDEFRARREAKIAEIRRTGKTWQWTGVIRHQKRAWETGVALALVLAGLAAVAVVLVLLVPAG